jgi:S-adenosyl-L-methionine hydrolase (adenosine-forming)
MIVLFTDFGIGSPYVGQLKAVFYKNSITSPILDLMHNAPAFRPVEAGYLLSSYINEFPDGSIFLCVVDPQVGNPDRKAIIIQADDKWFVGADNELFDVILSRAKKIKVWDISDEGEFVSNSFHGRDIFAPAIVSILLKKVPGKQIIDIESFQRKNVDQDLHKVIYIDNYGNSVVGIRADQMFQHERIKIGKNILPYKRTFYEQRIGQGFWFVNSNGLVEIAINQGDAAKKYGLKIGFKVTVLTDDSSPVVPPLEGFI